MRVGVPKEVKPDEYRVAMMPVGAEQLIRAGHEVVIEAGAGVASGFSDVYGGSNIRRRWAIA